MISMFKFMSISQVFFTTDDVIQPGFLYAFLEIPQFPQKLVQLTKYVFTRLFLRFNDVMRFHYTWQQSTEFDFNNFILIFAKISHSPSIVKGVFHTYAW